MKVPVVLRDKGRIETLQTARQKVFVPFRESGADIGLPVALNIGRLLPVEAPRKLESSIRAFEQKLG